VNTFKLVRDVDLTGLSGTGEVAEGVEFSDGTVAVRWAELPEDSENYKRGVRATTVLFQNIKAVLALHGHNGATRLVWDDSSYPAPWQEVNWEPGPQGVALCEVLDLDPKGILGHPLYVLVGLNTVHINYTGGAQRTLEQWEKALAILDSEVKPVR
jgi:hypothetical protein